MRIRQTWTRECKWLKRKKKRRKKNIGRVRQSKWVRKNDGKNVREWKGERERERKGCNWACVRVHGDDPVKMRQNERREGPCIGGGVERTVSKKKTMYRPSTSRKMCVYPPPQEKERGKKKKRVPRYPPLSSPCVPSCNHRPPPVIAVMNRGPAGLSIIFCTV